MQRIDTTIFDSCEGKMTECPLHISISDTTIDVSIKVGKTFKSIGVKVWAGELRVISYPEGKDEPIIQPIKKLQTEYCSCNYMILSDLKVCSKCFKPFKPEVIQAFKPEVSQED